MERINYDDFWGLVMRPLDVDMSKKIDYAAGVPVRAKFGLRLGGNVRGESVTCNFLVVSSPLMFIGEKLEVRFRCMISPSLPNPAFDPADRDQILQRIGEFMHARMIEKSSTSLKPPGARGMK